MPNRKRNFYVRNAERVECKDNAYRDEDFGYTEEVARRFHEDMIYYSYGIAILLNTGSISLDDNELIAALQREFKALTAVYGEPKNKYFKGETT